MAESGPWDGAGSISGRFSTGSRAASAGSSSRGRRAELEFFAEDLVDEIYVTLARRSSEDATPTLCEGDGFAMDARRKLTWSRRRSWTERSTAATRWFADGSRCGRRRAGRIAPCWNCWAKSVQDTSVRQCGADTARPRSGSGGPRPAQGAGRDEGFGPALVDKISTLVTTEAFLLDELRASPGRDAGALKVPGLGSKKARAIHVTLGISSSTSSSRAKDGRLRDLDGFGAASERRSSTASRACASTPAGSSARHPPRGRSLDGPASRPWAA